MENKELVEQQEQNNELKKCVETYLAKNSGLTQNEVKEFAMLCLTHKLNPLKGEIYAIKYGNKPLQVISNYYVYLKRADATGLLDYYNVEIDTNENGIPTIGRFVGKRKDQSKELVMTFVFKEWNQGQSTWVSKPHFMFDKCIVANGMRRLFPNELGNMPYVNEELWYWNKQNEDIVKEHIALEENKQEAPQVDKVLVESEKN